MDLTFDKASNDLSPDREVLLKRFALHSHQLVTPPRRNSEMNLRYGFQEGFHNDYPFASCPALLTRITEEPLRREIVSKAFAITPFVQADSLLVTFFQIF
jgi:hypothetical protein